MALKLSPGIPKRPPDDLPIQAIHQERREWWQKLFDRYSKAPSLDSEEDPGLLVSDEEDWEVNAQVAEKLRSIPHRWKNKCFREVLKQHDYSADLESVLSLEKEQVQVDEDVEDIGSEDEDSEEEGDDDEPEPVAGHSKSNVQNNENYREAVSLTKDTFEQEDDDSSDDELDRIFKEKEKKEALLHKRPHIIAKKINATFSPSSKLAALELDSAAETMSTSTDEVFAKSNIGMKFDNFETDCGPKDNDIIIEKEYVTPPTCSLCGVSTNLPEIYWELRPGPCLCSQCYITTKGHVNCHQIGQCTTCEAVQVEFRYRNLIEYNFLNDTLVLEEMI